MTPMERGESGGYNNRMRKYKGEIRKEDAELVKLPEPTEEQIKEWYESPVGGGIKKDKEKNSHDHTA